MNGSGVLGHVGRILRPYVSVFDPALMAVVGSLAVIASNLMFMTLAFQDDPSLTGLAIVVSADNLAMGIAEMTIKLKP